ncbi:MAG: DUF2764 family protein [Aureliella sp.]
MSTNRAYYTLVASLPTLPARFDVQRCPISWPRLEARLRMLEEDDQLTLKRLIDFLAWDRQPHERTDQDVIAHYQALMASETHSFVRWIVDQRIESRLIISAIRRRQLGLPPPSHSGPWSGLIKRRWNLPQFGLQARFPWVAELDRLLAAGMADQIERLVLSVQWITYSRAADRVFFSFEAVLLYVARWAIVQRWTSQDAQLGRERFESTLAKLLESHVLLHH